MCVSISVGPGSSSDGDCIAEFFHRAGSSGREPRTLTDTRSPALRVISPAPKGGINLPETLQALVL